MNLVIILTYIFSTAVSVYSVLLSDSTEKMKQLRSKPSKVLYYFITAMIAATCFTASFPALYLFFDISSRITYLMFNALLNYIINPTINIISHNKLISAAVLAIGATALWYDKRKDRPDENTTSPSNTNHITPVISP